MDGTREARQEYLKFLLLLLFFAALMTGAALLRPLLMGRERAAEPSPTLMSILVEATRTLTLTPTPTATSTLATSPEPTLHSSPTLSPLVSPSSTSMPSIYLVKAGDTLYRIGREHGLTVEDLVKANGLSDPDRILVGQELVIPVAGATAAAAPTSTPAATPTETPVPTVAVRHYTVQWGDTLWRIARNYGVELELLVDVNQIEDPARIVAGQVLEIPR